jgi:hypothetical protein
MKRECRFDEERSTEEIIEASKMTPSTSQKLEFQFSGIQKKRSKAKDEFVVRPPPSPPSGELIPGRYRLSLESACEEISSETATESATNWLSGGLGLEEDLLGLTLEGAVLSETDGGGGGGYDDYEDDGAAYLNIDFDDSSFSTTSEGSYSAEQILELTGDHEVEAITQSQSRLATEIVPKFFEIQHTDGYWEFSEQLGTLLGIDVEAVQRKIETAGLKSLGTHYTKADTDYSIFMKLVLMYI